MEPTFALHPLRVYAPRMSWRPVRKLEGIGNVFLGSRGRMPSDTNLENGAVCQLAPFVLRGENGAVERGWRDSHPNKNRPETS